MGRLESLWFLLACTLAVTSLIGFVVWKVIEHFREARAWSREIALCGWTADTADSARDRLAGTRLASNRAELDPVAVKGRAWVAGFHISRRYGPSTYRSLLIVQRRSAGPIGALQHRTGEMFERLVIGVARSVSGSEPEVRPGWEWALIAPAGTWFADEASERLRALLRPDEQLHLSADHVILSVPEGRLHALLRDERVETFAML